MAGKYVNKGNYDFVEARNAYYVDKSELIGFINRTLSTPAKMTCVSRARRFGKSLALQMLYAYYDCSCDSHALFDDLKIAKDPTYPEHLNKYWVIHLDITTFITGASGKERIIDEMIERVIEDIKEQFPEVQFSRWNSLMDVLLAVATQTNRRFIMLIDEWDALCREASDMPQLLEQYISLLRNLFKSDNTNRVFAGVYMTGILPIKNYGTQSALNNFRMYSMTNPEPLERFYGFTEEEVRDLCLVQDLDYKDLTHWYNGYHLGKDGVRIYNPTSVMTVATTRVCKGYWTQTESFESIRDLIDMNFDGVKEALTEMLIEHPVKVSVSTFGNDSNVLKSKDELFTLLIHYGYLSYDMPNQTVSIPNWEVRQELLLAVKNGSRPELVKMITESELLLKKTWEKDAEFVQTQIDKLHSQQVAPRFYNDEQALRSLIHLAYIAAVDEYVEIQELPSGKGYVDIAFIPRKRSDKPAMIVELKYNQTADGAIKQIHNRNYPQLVRELANEVLLVGINYDKKTKVHECSIESISLDKHQVGTKLGLSWNQVGTKLGLSQDELRLLLGKMTEPVSASALRNALGYTNATKFKNKYLQPLIDDGCIAMTRPDTPTSPKQEYYLTKKGRTLLESIN